jgi:hypothetical protein
MSTKRRRSKSVRQVTINAIAGLIVALLISLAGLVIHQLDSKTAGASSPGTTNPTSATTDNSQSSPSPTEVQSQTNASSDQQSPTKSPAQPSFAQSSSGALSSAPVVAEYLSDLTPLPNDTPDTTPQQMGGIYYLHSISTDSGGCGDDYQDTYSYVINREYHSFTATVGLNDQSLGNTPVGMEIDADGRTIYSGVFTAGKIIDVKLDIAGVRELDLKQTYLGPDPNICSSNVTIVWGNAEVLP